MEMSFIGRFGEDEATLIAAGARERRQADRAVVLRIFRSFDTTKTHKRHPPDLVMPRLPGAP
jgi:hypothetical protein